MDAMDMDADGGATTAGAEQSTNMFTKQYMTKAEKAAARENKHSAAPWVEKYRPRVLADVCYQDEAVSTLKKVVESGNLPHLLFYGPPGTGKTSSVLALARELYGGSLMKTRVLELNASNERGIDVIRNKVKQFASTAVSKKKVKGHPCPPYKIIILDEADSMTKQAQSALRRTMEVYTSVTRFCIICNYVSRIIGPITSRCAKFRFRPLTVESMQGKIAEIALSEQANIEPSVVTYLLTIARGDMRRAITLLQSAMRISENGNIDSKLVDIVGTVIPKDVLQIALMAAKKTSFRVLEEAVSNIVAEAYPVDDLLVGMQELITYDDSIPDTQKAAIAISFAESGKKLLDGADEYLQILAVFSAMSATLAKPK